MSIVQYALMRPKVVLVIIVRLLYGFVGGLLYSTKKFYVILIAVALRRLLRAENQTLSYGKQAL